MNFRSAIDNAKFQYRSAQQEVEREEEYLNELRQTVENYKQAVSVVQVVAQSVEQAIHNKIAAVVTSCLEAVFDDPYEFAIRFERKRGKTEAELLFKRNGLEVDPMTAAGGGAVDVAAFALRVACLSIQKHLEQVLILDEPFRFVSKEYRSRVRAMIEKLSETLGIQFIIVTHMDVLRTGKVIDLSEE